LSDDNLTKKTQKKDPFTSLHKIKENLPHWAKLEILRNGALTSEDVFPEVELLFEDGVTREGALQILVYLGERDDELEAEREDHPRHQHLQHRKHAHMYITGKHGQDIMHGSTTF